MSNHVILIWKCPAWSHDVSTHQVMFNVQHTSGQLYHWC